MARFLEGQDLKSEALEMTTDSSHRFDLAVELGRLDIATELAHTAAQQRQVGRKANLAGSSR